MRRQGRAKTPGTREKIPTPCGSQISIQIRGIKLYLGQAVKHDQFLSKVHCSMMFSLVFNVIFHAFHSFLADGEGPIPFLPAESGDEFLNPARTSFLDFANETRS